MSIVYWAFDATCSDPADSGYIGVTEDRHARLSQLRKRLSSDARMLILFKGTREECLDLERRLRPRKSMGWNKAIGGTAIAAYKHGRAPMNFDDFNEFWHDRSRSKRAALEELRLRAGAKFRSRL
jgi:hypothetical protein